MIDKNLVYDIFRDENLNAICNNTDIRNAVLASTSIEVTDTKGVQLDTALGGNGIQMLPNGPTFLYLEVFHSPRSTLLESLRDFIVYSFVGVTNVFWHIGRTFFRPFQFYPGQDDINSWINYYLDRLTRDQLIRDQVLTGVNLVIKSGNIIETCGWVIEHGLFSSRITVTLTPRGGYEGEGGWVQNK